MTKEQFLELRLNNQYLLQAVPRLQVVKNTCGLQAQFFNYPRHTLRIRAIEKDNDWTSGLIKAWALRGTIHLIDPNDYALFMSVKSDTTYFDSWFSKHDIDYYGGMILECINKGINQKKEIAECVRQHFEDDKKFEYAFSGWGGLFYMLANRGKIIFDSVTTRGFIPAPKFQKIDYDQAMLTLLKRYFDFYSPATLDDCASFFLKPKTQIKKYIKELNLYEFYYRDKVYYTNTFDCESTSIPKIIFLAGFDPMLIGYKDRNSVIEKQYYRGVFTTTGLILPSIMFNGQIIAKWKENDKDIIITPFFKFDSYIKTLIEDYVQDTFNKTSVFIMII